MSCYQLCTTGTSLLCSIYVFILHTGRQNLLYQARVIDVALGERKQRKRTFFFLLFYIHAKPPGAFR